jgi:ATP-binding cassette, subfamily B, multidrug efflux pump
MQGLRLLFPYLKKYKFRLALGLFFVTTSNICSTYTPRIVGNTIDIIKTGHFTSQDIIISIIYLLLLTLGSGFFMFLTRQTIIVASRLIEFDLRNDFLFAIESQPMSYFHKNSTGNLMSHATNDIQAAREFLGPAIMYFANAVTTFSFAMYFMLKLNPIITTIALIPLPIITVVVYFIGKKVYSAFKDVQERFSSLTTQAQESFSGIRVIRSYVREKYENKLFFDLSEDYMQKNMRLARIQALMMPTMLILIGLSQLFVLGFGGWQVIHNQATLGDLTQFFIYINLLIWPVAAIGWVTNLVQRAGASCTRLQNILDSKPEINQEIIFKKGIKNIEGTIEFQNVSLNYENTTNPALNNVSFKLEKVNRLELRERLVVVSHL